jgi:integrase
MRTAGRGDRTIQACYDALRACYNYAIKTDRILTVSPMMSVPRPTHHYEMSYYSREEAQRFLAAVAGDRLRALFHLVVAVGLRRGEILGLKWRDVNFADTTLSVRRALADSGAMKSTKTKRSQRLVVLPQSIVDELLAHRERLEAEKLGECELVFPARDGSPMAPITLYDLHFVPAMKRAKLHRIRFHDLRHTAATIRLAAGDHPNVVQEMLGHTKVETTLGVYGHVVPTMQRDSAALYDRLMTSKSAPM